MHPEEWQSIDRLLLCGVNVTAIEFLAPALQQLRLVLPKPQMTLLLATAGYPPSLQLSGIQTFPVQDRFSSTHLEWLRHQSFDAAVIFTDPFRSPYGMAYLYYLAGIPLRIGQSQEFGGAVLSTCVAPPLESVSLEAYHLHLLNLSGLLSIESLFAKT